MTVKILYELISQNTRVILPEFGAFLVKNEGSKEFSPENVSFSPFLKYNDGMIEDYLCKETGVNKDQAAAQVAAFINSIRDKLSRDNIFPIDRIGELHLDDRGVIKFYNLAEISKSSQKEKKQAPSKEEKTEPKAEEKAEEKKPEPKAAPIKTKAKEKQPEAVIEPEAKPEPTHSEPIKEKGAVEVAKSTDSIKTSVQPAKESKPETKPLAPKSAEPIKPTTKSYESTSSKSDSSSVGKAILIGLGIGLLVILIAVSTLYYLTREPAVPFDESFTLEPQEETTTTATEPEKTKPTEPKGRFDDEFDRISKGIEKEREKQREVPVAQPAPTRSPAPQTGETIDSTISAELPPVSPDGTFHIIVGSFRNLEYAEKFSEDMIRSGYSSTVITQPSGMHAVTLGSYATREGALKAMGLIKNQHPNVWLLSQ